MALTGEEHRVLVEAHRRGDGEAFPAIVRRYYEGLFAHALHRLGDAHAAEDAVQETLARAYRALPALAGEFQVRAWLHRILTNVCHDEGRRRQRETALVDRVSGTAADVATMDDDLDRIDLPREELLSAMSGLPESYREALILRYVNELSFSEMARATGVSEGNARLRVHRGRLALRRAMVGSLGVIGFLVPWLRRGERPAVASITTSALATNAPLAARVAETAGVAVAERAPSIASLLGVAATLVVPAAVPMVSGSLADVEPVLRSPVVVTAGPAPVDARTSTAGEARFEGIGTTMDSGTTMNIGTTMNTGTTTDLTPTTALAEAAPPPAPTTTAASEAPTATGPVDEGALGGGAEDGSSRGATATTLAAATPDALVPPPPRPRLPATIESSDIVVSNEGRQLSGSTRLRIGDDTVDVRVDGSLSGFESYIQAGLRENEGETTPGALGPAAPAPAVEPRTGHFSAELSLGVEGGARLRMVLAGDVRDQAAEGSFILYDSCGDQAATGSFSGLLALEDAPSSSGVDLTFAGFAPDLASLTVPC